MNKAGAAKRKEEPLQGEAALKAALADFGAAQHAPGTAGRL